MVFDRETLVIPAGAEVSESLAVTGDVVVADGCRLRKGISTPDRIFVGEHVRIEGDLESQGEIRIDRFTRVRGNLQSGSDVSIGDRCDIQGTVLAAGNLDVGSDARIADFEARGWINVRSKVPLILYFLIYILELLRRGEDDAAEALIQELEDVSAEDILVSDTFTFLPRGTRWEGPTLYVRGGVRIGADARIESGIVAKGSVHIMENAVVRGDVVTRGDTELKAGATVLGDISAVGPITLGIGSRVEGSVRSEDEVVLMSDAHVAGPLFATSGVRILNAETPEVKEKIIRFESDLEFNGLFE